MFQGSFKAYKVGAASQTVLQNRVGFVADVVPELSVVVLEAGLSDCLCLARPRLIVELSVAPQLVLVEHNRDDPVLAVSDVALGVAREEPACTRVWFILRFTHLYWSGGSCLKRVDSSGGPRHDLTYRPRVERLRLRPRAVRYRASCGRV